MSANWENGFRAARVASSLSNGKSRGKRLGAAIFFKNKLVSLGFNVYGQTHPDAKYNIHAEHKAVLKRQYYPNDGGIMYVYREIDGGWPACSKPCKNCQTIIREAGIKKVRYIDDNGYQKEMIL